MTHHRIIRLRSPAQFTPPEGANPTTKNVLVLLMGGILALGLLACVAVIIFTAVLTHYPITL